MIESGFWELPMHPAFTHFPVAMLTGAWAFVVLGHLAGAERWSRLVAPMEWIGLAFIPLTIVTGLRDADGLDFLTDADWSQPLIWHFLVALACAAVFLAHAIWRLRVRPTPAQAMPPAGGNDDAGGSDGARGDAARGDAARGSSLRATMIDLGLVSLGFWLLVLTGLLAGEMVFG